MSTARLFAIEGLENRLLLAAQPVISEILASNGANLADKDGEFSDWIEIHNRGDQPADLTGWRLVDDPADATPWTFPAVTLNPGERIVVFASDKNVLTGAELHTDFKLDAGGEYLALIAPDGTTASEFSPFPTQSQDISWGISPDDPGTYQYFSQPTPGQPNQLIASAPLFSLPSTTFNGAVSLALSLPPDASPTAQIRYTLDRTAPTATSPLYTGPLNITRTTVVRARVFENGVAPGPIASQSYISVDSTVRDFNSNLPVVIVDTFGSGMNSSSLTSASAYFIDTAADGRARMLDLPDFSGRGGIRIRGQSSEGFPKDQFAFETWDESNNDRQVSILGMPSESDWILYAPYSEKSLMQNFLAYKWSNDIGQYAVRTRYVEVFLNTDNGASINYSSDYHGVYIFMERIDVGQDRVDIADLNPQDSAEPDITGGYIFKNDKNDGNEIGVTTGRGHTFLFHDPGENELTAAQKDWLRNHLNEFETVLYGANFRDPVNGYAKYIDVDSFIDHHIMVELAKNIDGFRISTYYHKDRGGKIKMGPVWDYNLSMGNANYGSGNTPTGWYNAGLSDDQYRYFRRLFADPDFAQRYIDRWQELRAGELSTTRMMADINDLVSLLSDGNGNYPVGSSPQQPSNNPVVRNFKRWPILGQYVWPNAYVGNAWIDEVNYLKNFMTQRAAWIDSQYIAAPTLSRGTGSGINQPVQVTLATVSGRQIYYTLDGSDPRLPGGALSSSAVLYSAPFTINSSTRVKARVRVGGSWSGLVDQAIGIDNGLRLTELNYHPDAPPVGSVFNDEDFEFIELRNTSNLPINLSGYRFDRGIDYTFGSRLTAGPLTLQDFQAAGTAYAASTLRSGPGATVASDTSGTFLRLLDSSGTASANRVAFAQTSQVPATRFTAELDFRASMTPGSGSIAGTPTSQSFDGGGTAYTIRRAGSAPGPNADMPGGPTGEFLRLMHDGVGSQNNRIRFNRTLSGAYNRIHADFDFRASSADAPADGFSILFLPTAAYGTSGAGAPTDHTAEEPNLPGVFAVGFDTYPHESTNEVSLHWNGVQVHAVNIPRSTLDLVAGAFHHARIELVHVAGGANVTIRLVRDAFSANPTTVNLITNHFIAGLAPYDSRVEFSARSGGANMSVDLDNIDVRYLNGADPAGFSVLLLPTSTFGASGAGTNLTHFSDRPNLSGVFAMDLEFDAATGVQNLVLHYNGSAVHTVAIARAQVDLLSAGFKRLKLDLTRDNDVNSTRATVSLVPVAGGTPITLASNLLIPGMSIYESRVELAGRAALSPTRIDVDNVSASWFREDAPVLAPGQHLVLVKNPEAFASRYPGVAFDGVYQGSLSNNGERLTLLDTAGAAAFDFSWSDSGRWPGRADGKASSLEIVDPNGDYSLAANWRSSSEYRGTPGGAGAGPLTGVIINEVLSNTDATLLDAIELYNAGPAAIDISGWFLSDSSDNYSKFRIPDGTVLQSGQYVVFDESDFNPTPQTPAPNHFALDGAHGDDVWLLQASPASGALLAFADSVHFGAAFTGETFGRVPNGSATGLIEPLTSPTLGSANSGPRFGPVVISEVMYHPADDNHDREFIELHNTSSVSIDVSGWRLDGAVSVVIPQGTVLGPGEFLALVRFDPNSAADSARAAAFRNFYAMPPGAKLAGPYTGLLDNAGDRIRLERPDAPPPGEPTFTPYVQVDQLDYGTSAPWPVSPDGGGDSLTRVTLTNYAGDPSNWTSRVPTPAALVASNSPVLSGTLGNDLMTLRLDPTRTLVQFFLADPPAGSPIFVRSLASLEQLTVSALAGTDRLNVDYTNGDPIPAGGLVFDGGAGDDVLNVFGTPPAAGEPAKPLRFDAGAGNGILFIRGGHFDLSTSHSGTLSITVENNRVNVQNLLNLSALNLNPAARLILKPGGQTHLLTQNLFHDASATLDLSDNALAVFGGASAIPRLAAVNARVAFARNSATGRWLGAGLTSSLAAANELLGVGVILNSRAGLPIISSLGGHPLTSEWIVVRAAPDGDTDLDNQVNADDAMRADRGYLTRNDADAGNDLTGFAWGDFNYDNATNISDFFLLDRGRSLWASQVLGAGEPNVLA